MKLLVTGGAGCLGSEIVRHFLPLYGQVIVMDNLVTGSKEWLPDAENLILIEGDVSDDTTVRELFQEYSPTHVVHGAASYASPDDWQGDLATNALGTLNVVRASERAGVKKIVYLQTALGYGHPDTTPIPTTHPIRPRTSYGISKVAGELYSMSSEVPQVYSFRLANVCAPRLAIGPFPVFYRKMLAGEPCIISNAERDFLDIEDFLTVLTLALRKEESVKRVFNISTGVGRSIEDVYLAVQKALNAKNEPPTLVPVGDDDVGSVVLDPVEARDYFGWEPKSSFDELARRQIQWFNELGVGEIRSHLKTPSPRG